MFRRTLCLSARISMRCCFSAAPSTATNMAAPASEYAPTMNNKNMCVNHLRDQALILPYIQNASFSPTLRPDLAVFIVKSRKPANVETKPLCSSWPDICNRLAKPCFLCLVCNKVVIIEKRKS